LGAGALIYSCLAASGRAEETVPRTYALPGQGTLELPVPKSWRSESQPSPAQVPSTIALRPAEGEAFIVRITSIPNPPQSDGADGDARIKKAALVLSKVMAPTAVEKDLPLTQLNGPTAHGYYFTATDKAPKPGEYLCMTSAVVGVGDLLLSVTILHQSKDAEEVQQAIEMLKEARLRKGST